MSNLLGSERRGAAAVLEGSVHARASETGRGEILSTAKTWDMYVCVHAQLCPTLCDPMDYSPLGSSVHGIFQARTLEWVAISSSRGIFLTQGSNPSLLCLLHCRQILYLWATGEAQDLKNPGWIQWLLQSSCFICMKAISFPQSLATPNRMKIHVTRPPSPVSWMREGTQN